MGAPKIDGGMTSAEYRALQMEERAWAESQEEKAYQRSLQMEADRREFEAGQQERLDAVAGAEELAIQDAERMLQDEIDDMNSMQETDNLNTGFDAAAGVALDGAVATQAIAGS